MHFSTDKSHNMHRPIHSHIHFTYKDVMRIKVTTLYKAH